MPVGYLVAAVLVGWCTVCALWPVRGSRALGTMSWGFGFVLNELPFVAFYFLFASTMLALGQGDLDSPGGWVAFGVAVLATVGLGVVTWRGLRAGAAVNRALSDALGVRSRRLRIPLARILFAPVFVRRRDVERVANIRYADAGKRNLLDVYRHRSHPSGGPTLIHLHGGRFVRGRKNREALPLIYRLASKGWVCISANYRLSPEATFPDHLIDVKKVIAWVRQHGQEYGADPSQVFVAGSSAGGHLASLAALTPDDRQFQRGFERADTSVAAAISLYGYYGPVDPKGGPSSSPSAYVGVDAPPFFIAHGDHDTYVPVERARAFAEQLRRTSSSPVVYAELPGAQHTFDLFHSIRFELLVDAIETFASWVNSRDV